MKTVECITYYLYAHLTNILFVAFVKYYGLQYICVCRTAHKTLTTHSLFILHSLTVEDQHRRAELESQNIGAFNMRIVA